MVTFPAAEPAFMSGRSDGLEWVETTEEVVITEECLTPENTAEPVETPIQRLLDTVDNTDSNDGFDCDECLTLFQDQSDLDNSNGPSFILDFPTIMGDPQRALLTLPYGLVIGRSSIPSAGVGVINHGSIVPLGMHFGPYEGEVTSMENSITSNFSWEICKGKDEYEYIDAARETHSNWMRYINCARNKEETNLLAVQYKDSILFHCCRSIQPGDELMVWPSNKLLSHFSETWAQVWLMKLKAAETNTTATSPVFTCSHCPLSFTTESFLQRHRDCFHVQPDANSTVLTAESVEPACVPESVDSAESVVVLSIDLVESNTCGDCGKVFKQIPHLKRHKLCVHANKRPYCCPQCRRSFSQASGLIRHQRVHRKQAVIKDTEIVTIETSILDEEESLTLSSEPGAVTEEMKDTNGSEMPDEAVDVSGTECVASQDSRSESSKSVTNESLKQHEVTVREILRPYVCSVCQRTFRQYCDLSRHLPCHQKGSRAETRKNPTPDESTVRPFSCADCSLAFSSVDHLQQHVGEHHSEESVVENQDDAPAPAGDDQIQDPDFIPHPSVAKTLQNQPSPRPQRLGARSKISAITKLIAPKRRAAVCKKPLTSAAQTETSSTEPQAPVSKTVKLTKYKWFSCNRCKRTYANPDELKVHKCALKQHKCGQCGMTFNKSGFLKRHEQTAHVGAKSYGCDGCAKAFSTSAKLKRHQKNATCRKHQCTSELFSCSFCQFSFTMKNYLIKHVKRHHPVEYLSHCDSDSFVEQLKEEEKEENECVCPHCEKTFTSAKSFKSHPCFQQVKVLYLCTDCGKGFTNHYGLKQHQRIHTGEKPYSCPHCSKSFSYTGQLNVHLRTHTGEKPYLCTHCGESFRQSGDLKRHERKHTGVRPYNCPECCKSFSRLQSLKAHQMLHLGQRMFKCTQCGKSFSRNYHLRRHHQKMHL
ncbi:histone-lysine N-methyltransferase PRDM9 [Antennarius striatus]|uniref:histone-lysine N-methyltransferase PRDM9 n=1 Tax=Antennarius striatus TaxID=241820 RepID=UPI0035AE1CC1